MVLGICQNWRRFTQNKRWPVGNAVDFVKIRSGLWVLLWVYPQEKELVGIAVGNTLSWVLHGFCCHIYISHSNTSIYLFSYVICPQKWGVIGRQ